MSDILDTDVAPFCHGQNHSGSVPIAKLGGASPAMAEMRKVEGGIGGGRSGAHTPIDPDTALAAWMGRDLAAHDERGIPMPQIVPADANRRRLGRQLPRPDNRNRDALGQYRTALTEREPSPRVLHRRQGSLAGLRLRATTPLHDEGLIQHSRVITQRLLLGDLGTFTQPRHRRARSGQQLPEPRERRLLPGSLLVDCFVPQPSTAPPLGQQRFLGSASRPKPVRVPHHLTHSNILSKEIAMRYKGHFRLFLNAVNGGVSEGDAR